MDKIWRSLGMNAGPTPIANWVGPQLGPNGPQLGPNGSKYVKKIPQCVGDRKNEQKFKRA